MSGINAMINAYWPKPPGPSVRARIMLVASPMGIDMSFIAPTPMKLLMSCFFRLKVGYPRYGA
jgi:hypothetical protein